MPAHAKGKKIAASLVKVTATTKTKKVASSTAKPKTTTSAEAKQKSSPASAKKRKISGGKEKRSNPNPKEFAELYWAYKEVQALAEEKKSSK